MGPYQFSHYMLNLTMKRWKIIQQGDNNESKNETKKKHSTHKYDESKQFICKMLTNFSDVGFMNTILFLLCRLS